MGTWKLADSKNFDDYMRSIGEGRSGCWAGDGLAACRVGAALQLWLLPCTPAASLLVKVGEPGDAEKVAACATACEACWEGSLPVPRPPHGTGHAGSWFPDQGWNPCRLQWKRRVLTTGPPGNSGEGAFMF